MTAKEIYEVLEAVEQGKQIQILRAGGKWGPPFVKFNQSHILSVIYLGETLRVKPAPRQPRERWQNVYVEGSSGQLWVSKESAFQAREFGKEFVECVHYREVVEE